MDMASAYSTFMNHGMHYGAPDPDSDRREPIVVTRVEDADGTVIYEAPEDGQEVLNPEIADQTTTIMRGVVTGGTGTAAALDTVPVAGKTGTTQNNKDAWFVGFRCNFVASVWMGYPGFDGQPVTPMTSVHGITVQGGTFPAEMWHDFMTRVDPMLNDDCELADVTDFAEGKDFEIDKLRDLGVGSGSGGTGGGGASCPAGYTPGDLNGDGQIESCVANGGGAPAPPPSPPATPPPSPTTIPSPSTTVPIPGPDE
jgi:membrane peptidoglycan carboxypeptidase